MRLPSTATVLAVIALFVSLTGTAVAAGAVPLAKKALFANNAGKLQGQTAGQIEAQAGPASTAASLVSSVTSPFALAAQGGKVTSPPLSADTRPTSDTTWTIYLFDPSDAGASGSVYAVCLK